MDWGITLSSSHGGRREKYGLLYWICLMEKSKENLTKFTEVTARWFNEQWHQKLGSGIDIEYDKNSITLKFDIVNLGDQVPFRFHSEIRSLTILVKSYQILSRTVQEIYRRKRGEVTNPIKICYCWIVIRSWPDLPQDCSKIDDGRSWQDLSTTFKIYSRVLQPDQSWQDPRQTSVKIRGRSCKHVPSRILNRILQESEDNQGSGSFQVL